MLGKTLRARRFKYPKSKFGMIVPIDHGLTIGPVEGLETSADISKWISHPMITGVIAHKGMLERLIARDALGNAGVMVHLNGMSTLAPSPDRKERVSTMETALKLGADGVSLQINFDGENDSHNLTQLGQLVDEASEYGLPVLTMLYDKVKVDDTKKRVERARHLIRIAIELGSDFLKLGAPANLAEVDDMIDGLSEDIPIFFAGGALCDDRVLFELTSRAIAHGGAGLCVGRNVFQRPDPGALLTKLGHQIQLMDKPVFRIEEPKRHELGIH